MKADMSLNKETKSNPLIAQLTGAVEYTDYFSTDGKHPASECPGI